MSIFKKKATVIAGLFCAVACCFSLGFSTIKAPTKADAEATIPAATNVEDLINGSVSNMIGYTAKSAFNAEDMRGGISTNISTVLGMILRWRCSLVLILRNYLISVQ